MRRVPVSVCSRLHLRTATCTQHFAAASACGTSFISRSISVFYTMSCSAVSSKLARPPRLSPADVIAEPKTDVERAKKLAAQSAINEHVESGMAIGVGSGSTIVYAIQRLAERARDEGLNVACVPTSFQSKQLLMDTGLPVYELSQYPELDVAIDGADEVDSALNCIKGGGACQTQEKLVASAAKKFVVVADHTKQADVLLSGWKKGIPIEVLPMAYVSVTRHLEKLSAGSKAVLRMAVAKAGPVVTDNGCFVLDYHRGTLPADEVRAVHERIKLLPGVVETGLFPGMAAVAYFGQADGTVVIRRPAV